MLLVVESMNGSEGEEDIKSLLVGEYVLGVDSRELEINGVSGIYTLFSCLGASGLNALDFIFLFKPRKKQM